MATKDFVIKKIHNNSFHFVMTGATADGDVSQHLNCNSLGIIPDSFVLNTFRTAGAQNVVSVFLQTSTDGTNWTSIKEITSSAGTAAVNVTGYPSYFLRILVTTVGAGNTLTVEFVGSQT